jgi:hypothetical protein
MAAALGEALVLELDSGGADALERAHGVPHVDRVAEAGVGIDDERQGGGIGDRPGRPREVRQGSEADIGHAEPGIGEAGAGQVDRLEAEILDDARPERVGGARHQERAPVRYRPPQSLACGHPRSLAREAEVSRAGRPC